MSHEKGRKYLLNENVRRKTATSSQYENHPNRMIWKIEAHSQIIVISALPFTEIVLLANIKHIVLCK